MPREVSLEKTRNIGIMAHIDAGKTTTTERILYYTGVNHKIGETHEGTPPWTGWRRSRSVVSPSPPLLPPATGRAKDSASTSSTPRATWTSPLRSSVLLRVLDGSVTVLCAKGGVEPQSETVWRQADHYHVPRMVYVNKMDIMGADFYHVVDMMHDRLHCNAVPIQLPIGRRIPSGHHRPGRDEG